MRVFFKADLVEGSRAGLQVVDRDGQRYAQVIGLTDFLGDPSVLAEVLIEDPPDRPGEFRLDWTFRDAE